MKLSGLTISAVLLLALVGGLYWSNHHKPAEPAARTDVPPKILSLIDADITKVDLKKKTGEEIELVKNPAGKWEMTEPKKLPVDQETAISMVSSLASLTSD
ncbi:MAG: hypothetical protein ABSH09_30025, partial [Bryobacteraceae bacterium]